jgi:hypothetical protein
VLQSKTYKHLNLFDGEQNVLPSFSQCFRMKERLRNRKWREFFRCLGFPKNERTPFVTEDLLPP